MKKRKPNSYNILNNFDELSESKKENFESLVDLFTLLSFVLIIAAILFGHQNIQKVSNIQQSSLIFRETEEGSGTPADLPLNTIVLVITKGSSNNDILYFVKSGDFPKIIYQTGQKESLWNSLEKKKSDFKKAQDIQIVVNNEKQRVNADLFLILQNWLAHYSFSAIINFQGITNEKQL